MHHDLAEMEASEANMTTDPVCGMKVDIGARGPSYAHAGETYRFCSEGCRGKFAADPERYLTKQGEAEAAAAGHALHLPHAPADREGGSWPLPDLRHGPRADGHPAGDQRQPRADRFYPSAESRRAALARAARARHGEPCIRHRSRPLPVGKRQAMAAIRSSLFRRCCGAAGRSSCAVGTRSTGAGSTCSP